jgi:hypothetical protein
MSYNYKCKSRKFTEEYIITMKRKIIYCLLLLFSINICSHSQEATIMDLVLCGYIEANEDLHVDNNLDFSSFRLQFYQFTEWGQKIGGFLSIVMSSSELIEAEHEDIYGGLFAGVMLGQTLTLSRFSASVHLLLGPGGSVSTLRQSPRHLDFFSEINVETGIAITGGLKISALTGFQCIGNLFPLVPGTDYLMYYPVWGISFTWS